MRGGSVYRADRRLRTAFWAGHLGIPLLLLATTLVLVHCTTLDLAISELFYDPLTHSFPARHHWLLETWLHDRVKAPVVVLAITVASVLPGSLIIPALRSWRPLAGYVITGMLACALIIGLIKHSSSLACPSDLQLFGGTEPHNRLFGGGSQSIHTAGCWPGAHVVTAFCLYPWYFATRYLGKKRCATTLLVLITGFGLLLAGVQTARGAHFLSHNLFTGIFCWLISLSGYPLLNRHSGTDTGDGPAPIRPERGYP